MEKTFSDLTEQSLTATTEILTGDNSITDKFSKITGQKILDFIVTAGYLTSSEISTLINTFSYLTSAQISTLIESYGYKTEAEITAIIEGYSYLNEDGVKALTGLSYPPLFFAGGELSGATDVITLDSDLSCRDDSDTINISIAQGFTKLINSSFVEGTGNGGFDNGATSTNGTYEIYAISKADGTSDILFSALDTVLSLPSGFLYQRKIGYFDTEFLDAASILNVTTRSKYLNQGLKSNVLPYNYISDNTVLKSTSASTTMGYVRFHHLICRDDSNTVNIVMNESITFDFTEFGTTDTSLIEGSSLVKSSIYYIYAIAKEYGTEPTYIASVNNPTAFTLPTNYLYKRLVGFMQTFIDITDFFTWTINEKWDDENFDVAILGKSNTIETSAPEYLALFSGSGNDIKVAAFANGVDRYIDAGKEYAHAGKNESPIRFHAHCYAEDATAGDIVLFIDYLITCEGDTTAATAPTRILSNASTSTVPGVLGQHFTVNFDWITDADELKEGSQIWFRFGRLGSDSGDTYGSEIAIRTFGYHYLIEAKGSDLETSNI